MHFNVAQERNPIIAPGKRVNDGQEEKRQPRNPCKKIKTGDLMFGGSIREGPGFPACHVYKSSPLGPKTGYSDNARKSAFEQVHLGQRVRCVELGENPVFREVQSSRGTVN